MLETLPTCSDVQPQLQPHPLLQEDFETREHPESESTNGEFRCSAPTSRICFERSPREPQTLRAHVLRSPRIPK